MSRLWHYVQNGKSEGPIAEEDLKALVSCGTLRPSDLAWCEGMASWTPLESIPELAPPPPPEPEVPQAAAPPQAAQMLIASESTEPLEAVSSEAVETLRLTKPWVRFLAVLGLVGIILLVLAGAAAALFGGALLQHVGARARIWILVSYLVMALLYLPPLIFLNAYASRIGALVDEPTPARLESALRAQKAFWKYVGIFTLVFMILYLVLLVVGLVAGLALGVRNYI